MNAVTSKGISSSISVIRVPRQPCSNLRAIAAEQLQPNSHVSVDSTEGMNDQNNLSVQQNQKMETILARHRITLGRINIQPLGTTSILDVLSTKSIEFVNLGNLKSAEVPSDRYTTAYEYHRDSTTNRKRKQQANFARCGCPCSPLCLWLCLLAAIILLAALGTILVALLTGSRARTTTTETSISTTTTTATSTSTTTTATTKTTVTTSTTTQGAQCSLACNSQQMCIEGECVGIGYLSFTLSWSRRGDGDIAIATPNGLIINYNNRGPNSVIDWGELDRDDLIGKVPENVYWSRSDPLPPTGIFHLCFVTYSSSPPVSSTDPVTATFYVTRPSLPTVAFTRTFTSSVTSYSCSSSVNNLLGSITYP